MIGQEVVKAVSGTDEPINNFFFWDGLLGSGVQKAIPAKPKPPPPAGKGSMPTTVLLLY
jgi:hypothetical protein